MRSKILFILSLALVLPGVASAKVVNPNAIISDPDMVDFTSMSLTGIQSFLKSSGGVLGDYRTNVNGVEYSAAEVIYSAAQRTQLNPQFLIAQLQKESSVVTGHSTTYLDWAMGYAVCDGCSKEDPQVLKYKGFYNQVNASADRFRSYLTDLSTRNSTISGWGVGRSKTSLDQVTITPQNKATAAVFTYTPWLGYYGGDTSVGGNSLLVDVMDRFFPDRNGLASRLNYPDGILFQSPSGSVYRLADSKLRPITSKAALLANYDTKAIIPVGYDVLNRYEQGSPISYPKFILIQSKNTGAVYIIDENYQRRGITSKEMLHQLGYNPEEMVPVAEADLSAIPEGSPLTTADKYPLGALLQNDATGGVMYFDSTDDTLHPIIDRSIINKRFKGYTIYQEQPQVFQDYEVSSPVQFEDGTLVKIPERNTIYVIDNGQKRAITSPKILKKLGGKKNIVMTSKKVLKLHTLGEPLTVITTTPALSGNNKSKQ